jgi:drug/metabolite transporter (DMT)-like permease
LELHRTSGRHGLGLALASTTMALWAVLPIALQGVLRVLDAFTITWARCVVAVVVLGGVLGARSDLPPLRGVGVGRAVLLVVATLFLAANYAAFLIGLDWTSAADAQVLTQLGPILLSVGGIAVFRERFAPLQWVGLAVLLVGVAVFVVARLGDALPAGRGLEQGMAMIVLAAATWAVYGLAQKQLLHTWTSSHVLLCVYAGCAIAFTPFAAPASLAQLDATRAVLLGFCALNTVAGYGAFAESLAHWEASRVGAVLALTPIGTLAFAAAIDAIAPEWAVGQSLSFGGWLGALLVVAGSLAASLGASRASGPPYGDPKARSGRQLPTTPGEQQDR